ncbi:MAG: N-formylglutamate amidohydrolase [Maricaulaceae bacterium]
MRDNNANNPTQKNKDINAAEAACLAAFTPAFSIDRPTRLSSPLIFASPHSGHIYPQAFLSQSALSLPELRRNEDAFIDALFAPASTLGAPLLRAHFPRCFLDVNRAANELPPSWGDSAVPLSARAEAGYGVIPLAIAENMPIYTQPPSPNITAGRIEGLYHPYHNALKALITQAKHAFGHAIIIDCHSMPGFAPMGARRADIVLGDCYGKSCEPETIAFIEQSFKTRGYSVTRNYPYAGGYVTSYYAKAYENVQTLQIEINRDLYLNPVTLKPKRSYKVLAQNLEIFIQQIIAHYSAPMAEAAE